MRVVACVCVRMCGRECACLRVREDHSVQGSKEGFEGFSDTFAVKDRLPRFDVMLAPAMALGSVRAFLRVHCYCARACVCACVRAFVRAFVRACACARLWGCIIWSPRVQW